jgi:uncharacterized membrane protein
MIGFIQRWKRKRSRSASGTTEISIATRTAPFAPRSDRKRSGPSRRIAMLYPPVRRARCALRPASRPEPPMSKNPPHYFLGIPDLRRNLVAGFLALIPLWITWIVLEFLIRQFTALGRPWVLAIAGALRGISPRAADLLLEQWFASALALLVTVVLLYLLGFATTRVIGKQLLAAFENLLERIPLVKAIYGSAKSLVSAFQSKPEGAQRVVLISFPSDRMKVVGLVTRTFRDAQTGRELAAVYVPTTPNPTSGYLEIVPVEYVTPTNWTIEEAMSFIVTGGTTGPKDIVYGEDRPGD